MKDIFIVSFVLGFVQCILRNMLFLQNFLSLVYTHIYKNIVFFLFMSRCSFYCIYSLVIRIICVCFRLHWKYCGRNITTPFYLSFIPKKGKKNLCVRSHPNSNKHTTTVLLVDQMGRATRNTCSMLDELNFVNNFVMCVRAVMFSFLCVFKSILCMCLDPYMQTHTHR